MIKVITGNEAAAYGALLSRPDVICAYPITPQSRIPEQLSEFYAQGLLKGRFINAESEIAALGYVVGASSGGVRAFTATSSQGLAIMHEQLHFAAGANLPIVLVNVNRPLAAPWNLTSDQIDSLCERDSGWMQFYCETNQEILDTVIQAYKISEDVGLPSMVCMDGVYLSYVSESVDIPDQEKVDKYLPPYKASYLLPEPERRHKLWGNREVKPGGYHWNTNFMGCRYEQHMLEGRCLPSVIKAVDEFEAAFGRRYPPVEEYRCDDAEVVVVASGSHVATCRDVVDRLREKGNKVGLVKIKMFRPFPKGLVRKALLGRKKVAVIERDISPGQCGIFFQEIKWALNLNVKAEPIAMYDFISGLGGADITPKLIEKAMQYTMEHEPPEDVIWLGLVEKENVDDYDRTAIKIQ